MDGAKRPAIIRSVQQWAMLALLFIGFPLVRVILAEQFGVQFPPFFFFFPAITFAALIYGLWGGLGTTAASAVVAAWLMSPAAGKLQYPSPSKALALIIFSLIGGFMCVMGDRFRRTRQRVTDLEHEKIERGNKARLAAALESMTDAVFISDATGNFINFNLAFAKFHRFKRIEDCVRSSAEFRNLIEISTLDGEPLPPSMWLTPRALRGESSTNYELSLRRRDTEDKWIGSFNFGPIRDDEGEIIGAVIVARDVTEQKRIDNMVRASETRYRTVFQTSLDAIAINTLRGAVYIDINQAFLEMSGYERDEVIGRTSLELGLWTAPHDREQLLNLLKQGPCRSYQIRFRRKSGELFWGVMSASVIEIDGTPCIVSATRDVSHVKWAEEEIRNLALFDPLTGLANRRFLIEQVKKSAALSVQTHRKCALLLIDLDNFKILNDTLGHPMGDLLLQAVATRLQSCVREADTLGRLGGDEYLALVEDLGGTAEEAAAHALVRAEKILSTLDKPYLLDGHEWVCTCSIGIAIFGDGHENVSEALQQAELALYQAKAAGRNSLRFFEPALQAAVNARAALEESLRQGINADQFVIFYQGQFEQGRLVGAEALLRWNHPALGMLPPANFIPLAEETRSIIPLGNWILESVCRQIALWSKDRRTAHFKVSVNVSVVQLHQHEFVDDVIKILQRTGANPHSLRLELTESMLVSNVEDAIHKMTILKQHGVGFSLDDFGTGYSSLAYLRRLPVDQLKIDRSFVRDMLTDASSGVIAQTIITLSKAMGLPVIAEGVETTEQMAFLEGMGCHCFQGFLFSRPLPLDEFERMLPEFTLDDALFYGELKA
ncbi:MAG TPA: EAL domain-containing protein [Terracidiphilus sp.]|jgi:diguanylate cyclase (GGDEF)-like protein/PAS domain S-box-containing protein